MRTALRFIALLVGVTLLGAGPAAARPALWVVRDVDSEIVLFGSIHVLPDAVDWSPPALGAALARADDLWFEIPFDPATQARFGIQAQARGVLPPGQSLSATLTKTQRARLARVCQRLGVAQAEIERMRPWLAEIRLSLAALERERAVADSGVEQRLSNAAPPSARREAFETPEQQLAMFADAPLAEQVASLDDTLREIETDPKAYRRLIAAWMTGDPRALEAEALTPMKRAFPATYRRLVTDRNARWTETLARRMAGAGRTVVVVGAGHLAGPDGVPARLRALGFRVEGP